MEIEAEAILFDNDGVLVDSHAQTERAWSQLAAEFDLRVDTLLVELMGVRAADTLARYLTGPRLEAAVDRLEDLEVDAAPLTATIAGAADLLARLPTDRWTAVTSATRRLADARWRGAGLPISPLAVTAEDVTRGKPDPEPFVLGADRLGVDPARCLIFEDSPSGGAAARAAGATVVAVGDQPWPTEPTARVADLAAVSVSAADGAGPLRVALRLA